MFFDHNEWVHKPIQAIRLMVLKAVCYYILPIGNSAGCGPEPLLDIFLSCAENFFKKNMTRGSDFDLLP